jgi:excisionase family DNA binding protein
MSPTSVTDRGATVVSIYSTGASKIGPLVVKPREACRMLACGMTRLYELIANGEVDSYRDGRSRKITVASIERRIARLLAAAQAVSTPPGQAEPVRSSLARRRRQYKRRDRD